MNEGKSPWNKGIKISPNYTNYGMTNKKHSEKTKEKIGSALKGKHHSKKTKEKLSKFNKGKKLTEETKQKIRIANLGKKYLIDKYPNHGMKGKKHSKETIRKMKEKRKNWKIPVKDTSIELKIQQFLSLLHIEFLIHKYISEITHSYQCDIFIPTQQGIPQKIIVECDGCFFHACPKCNVKKCDWTLERRKLDNIRTEELEKKGFKVIRLWEHDIKNLSLNSFKRYFK